ncbi:MAG: OprO/OprP family phosphate-selective porin [Bacteroidales bacterium]|nr:OprO/OprP family phosphate-selective porin [Bacteroidales bacterium]
MKLIKNALLIAGLAAITSQAQAQITLVPENDQFSLKLIGRTNVDAGSFMERHVNKDGEEHSDNGIAVNDTRLGVAGSFNGNWDFKIEVCFAKKAISFRDVYVKYNFNKQNHIQVGNFFMPFGMKQLGLGYKFEEDATVDYAFCPSRKIGAAYLLNTEKFNFVGGVFSNGDVDNGNGDGNINAGVNLAAKAIVRPVIDETTVLHIGAGALYTNSQGKAEYKGAVPCTFESVTSIPAVNLNAPSYSRYEAELIFIKNKFLLETHFQGLGYESRGSNERHHLGGVLAQCSYLLIGEKQNYNKVTGLAANASPKSLELLCRYDYLELYPKGKQADYTVGLNYFFSKHFNLKLNYANVHADLAGGHESYNMIQARAQFSF